MLQKCDPELAIESLADYYLLSPFKRIVPVHKLSGQTISAVSREDPQPNSLPKRLL